MKNTHTFRLTDVRTIILNSRWLHKINKSVPLICWPYGEKNSLFFLSRLTKISNKLITIFQRMMLSAI